mgnify:CR=1 FL=1
MAEMLGAGYRFFFCQPAWFHGLSVFGKDFLTNPSSPGLPQARYPAAMPLQEQLQSGFPQAAKARASGGGRSLGSWWRGAGPLRRHRHPRGGPHLGAAAPWLEPVPAASCRRPREAARGTPRQARERGGEPGRRSACGTSSRRQAFPWDAHSLRKAVWWHKLAASAQESCCKALPPAGPRARWKEMQELSAG